MGGTGAGSGYYGGGGSGGGGMGGGMGVAPKTRITNVAFAVVLTLPLCLIGVVSHWAFPSDHSSSAARYVTGRYVHRGRPLSPHKVTRLNSSLSHLSRPMSDRVDVTRVYATVKPRYVERLNERFE